jgi:hypothetical protein
MQDKLLEAAKEAAAATSAPASGAEPARALAAPAAASTLRSNLEHGQRLLLQ